MLSSAVLVYFQENPDISGTLPTELGLLSEMANFGVFGAHITGTIPTEYGLLTNLNLFDISNTSVVGTIPAGLCVPGIEIKANCSAVQCC